MDILKKCFPFSFKEKDSISALVVNIVFYVIAGAVIGAVFALLSRIWFVGAIFGVLGGLVSLYFVIGIVLSVLDYLKILK